MITSKNFIRSTHVFFSALALWSQLAAVVVPAQERGRYPRIMATCLVMKISSGQSTNSEEVVIKDISGKPAYRLSVYFVSLEKQTTSSIHLELNKIDSSTRESGTQPETDLLNPDRWGHGAGQRAFLSEQLCAANRKDPEWGARRVFTLRRMKIEVRISDITLSESLSGIRQARVSVHVIPSSTTRSRPADIAYREPKPCT